MADQVGLQVIEGVSNGVTPFNEASKSNIGLIMERLRGVPNKVVMVSSLQEDRVLFGGISENQYGAYVTRHIFNNAGRFGAAVYGLRIVGEGSLAATANLSSTGSSPEVVMTLSAGQNGLEDPGIWGNDLKVTVIPAGDTAGVADYHIMEIYYKGILRETFQATTWALLVDILNASSRFVCALAGVGIAGTIETVTNVTLANGAYTAPTQGDFEAAYTDGIASGLAIFDGQDVQLIACSEHCDLKMAGAGSLYCKTRGDVLYVTSLPYASSAEDVGLWAAALQNSSPSFIAGYNFWVKTSNEASSHAWVPSIGVILGAGYIRAMELSRGHVWVPPGGIETSFLDVMDITNNPLSPETINLWVKRYTTNVAVYRKRLGFFLYSSRTYSTNPLHHSVHVRRLTNWIVRMLEENMMFTIQKSSTPELGKDAVMAVTMFFRGIYDEGGLERSIPFEEACIVTSDSTNNPASQDRKIRNIDIEWIPTECTESVVIRLSRNDGALIVKALETTN